MPVANTPHGAAMRVALADRLQYGSIRAFLEESSSLYPDIREWWDGRVVPGIVSGERVCHVASHDGQLTAVCIGKRHAHSAKLCTLRVKEGLRGYGIGQSLLHAALRDLLKVGTEKVHFTISEQVLNQCGVFFAPYGFRMLSWKKGRYVPGMDELVFEANRERVVRGLRLRDLGWGSKRKVVISIKPRYARLIEEGRKRVEFRRRFPAGLAGAEAFFYVSSPVKAFRFSARISNVIHAEPNTLWRRFGPEGGVGEAALAGYFEGASEGSALCLDDVRPLCEPVPLQHSQLQAMGFRPPQSFAVPAEGSAVLEIVQRMGE